MSTPNDLVVEDDSQTPQSFTPETTDLGTSTATGLKLRRAMLGANDGALVTMGSLSDPAWDGTTNTISSLVALLKALLAVAESPNPTNVAFATTPTVNLGTLGGGATAALQTQIDTDLKATQPRSIASNAPNVAQTGTLGAANATVNIATGQMGALGLQIAGTWVGTITFLGSVDGGTTYPVTMTARAPGIAPTNATSVNGNFFIVPAGVDHVQIVMSAYTSGTATVTAVQTTLPRSLGVHNTALDPLYALLTSGPKATKLTGQSVQAANSYVNFACDGYSTAIIQFGATASGTTGLAQVNATEDGGLTWFPINVVPVSASVSPPTPTSVVSPATTTQNFECACGGYDAIQVVATTAFSAAQTLVFGAYTGAKSVRAGLLPSENHVGEIGGNAVKVSTTFGPSASTTYTAGQVLMATTPFAGMARVNNGLGYLFGATLGLNVANTAQVDLFIFSAQPSGTYTAGGTFALTLADLPKLSKVIHLDDWTAAGTALSFGQPTDKGPRVFRCDDPTATQTLWVVAVARGSITLATTSDGVLTLRPARN